MTMHLRQQVHAGNNSDAYACPMVDELQNQQ